MIKWQLDTCLGLRFPLIHTTPHEVSVFIVILTLQKKEEKRETGTLR